MSPWFTKNYGLTPAQVRTMSLREIHHYLQRWADAQDTE